MPNISAEIARQLRANEVRKTSISRRSANIYITSRCVFCNEELTKKSSEWTIHFLHKHTRELAFKCSGKCKKEVPASKKCPHCKKKVERIYPEWNTDDLNALLCMECDYVKIYKRNMVRHVESEHASVNMDVDKMYTTHKLFSARNELIKPAEQDQNVSTSSSSASSGLFKYNLKINFFSTNFSPVFIIQNRFTGTTSTNRTEKAFYKCKMYESI